MELGGICRGKRILEGSGFRYRVGWASVLASVWVKRDLTTRR